jgi:hypothetical protein
MECESWGSGFPKCIYIIWGICHHEMAIQICPGNREQLALLGAYRNASHQSKHKARKVTVLGVLPQTLNNWSSKS